MTNIWPTNLRCGFSGSSARCSRSCTRQRRQKECEHLRMRGSSYLSRQMAQESCWSSRLESWPPDPVEWGPAAHGRHGRSRRQGIVSQRPQRVVAKVRVSSNWSVRHLCLSLNSFSLFTIRILQTESVAAPTGFLSPAACGLRLRPLLTDMHAQKSNLPHPR